MASGTSIDSNDQTTLGVVTPDYVKKAVLKVFIKGVELEGPIDSGSSENFIHLDLALSGYLLFIRSCFYGINISLYSYVRILCGRP